mmetsp:Transcript_10049/g.21184  ORF Transcript_10049/g.21184 Transcript_10049/m.21184 type:complete len:284 (-) Transcript_10049:37-888(-)
MRFLAYCAFLPPVSGAAKPKPRMAKPSAKHEFNFAPCMSSIMAWDHADTMIPTGKNLQSIGALLSKAPASTHSAARPRSFPMDCTAPRFRDLSAGGSASALPDRRPRATAPMRHASSVHAMACLPHVVDGRVKPERMKPKYPKTVASTTWPITSFSLPHAWCQPALRSMPHVRNLASKAQRLFATEAATHVTKMKTSWPTERAKCARRSGSIAFRVPFLSTIVPSFKLSGITSALPISIGSAARTLSAATTPHAMVAPLAETIVGRACGGEACRGFTWVTVRR